MNRFTPIFIFLIAGLSAQNADIDLLKSINQNRNKSLDNTFKTISNTVAPASIIAPLSVLSIGIITHDSAVKSKGAVMAASILLTIGVETGLKYSVNRVRPYTTYSFIDNVVSEGTPSFPSGHTSIAFSTATSLSLAFPKWYVIAPAYLWACSVGYSRMDLGAHYPSDVLGGAIIGAGTSYLCYKANKWLQRRHRKN
jgi:membrane-associated phospholipid phosphatase